MSDRQPEAPAGAKSRLASGPPTVESARSAYDAAMAAFRAADGLISHPLTEGKRALAVNRLKVATEAMMAALVETANAPVEAPFTPPPKPSEPKGGVVAAPAWMQAAPATNVVKFGARR